jgi:hypothetical protein
MPNTPQSVRNVWLHTFCLLALTAAACSDEATAPDDDSDDVVEERSPSEDDDTDTDTDTDTEPKRDAAGGGGGKRDAAVEAGSSDVVRDAGSSGGGMGDAGSRPRPDTRVDAGGAGARDAMAMVPVPVGDAGSVSGIPPEELEMLRKVCVDEINMYRATLSLAPIARASSEQEVCSDQGAKKDGDTRMAHSSSGQKNPCATAGNRTFPGFGSQNTCPGYPVGRGSATIAAALQRCLMQMWAEGEPPEGEAKCKMDYFAGNTKCFLAHGHYLNMKAPSKGVSCGFYNMGNNTYWMNQDFF